MVVADCPTYPRCLRVASTSPSRFTAWLTRLTRLTWLTWLTWTVSVEVLGSTRPDLIDSLRSKMADPEQTEVADRKRSDDAETSELTHPRSLGDAAGAPRGIRTPDLLIRSQTLYPD